MMEQELEAQLAEYQSQLDELAHGIALIPDTDPGYAELLTLQRQITDLKTLTEEQLLLEKKARLLGQYGGEEFSALAKKVDEPNALVAGTDDLDDKEDRSFKLGDLCRIPYRHVWGGVQMFNGMILDYNPTEATYRVHFLTPTDKILKTCPHFLQGHCRFEEKCNMSHGYDVAAADVQNYEPPDYAKLVQGASCLAEYGQDGIWYHATVQRVDATNDPLFTVKYRHYHTTAVLSADKLIPYGVYENDTYDTSSSEDEAGNRTVHHREHTPDHISQLGDSDSDSDIEKRMSREASVASANEGGDRGHRAGYKGDMAKWEESTKGFGSRMLAKMGYVIGTALKPGALVAPVKVELIPAGISLDYVAELRAKRAQGVRKGELGSENTAKIPVSEKTAAPTMFDFLNNAIGGGPSKRTPSQPDLPIEDFVLRKDGSRQPASVQASAADLRKNLFTLQETIRHVEKRLASDQQSLDRNVGRDRMMAEHAQGKVNETTKELQALHRQKEQLEKKLGSGAKSKKSIF